MLLPSKICHKSKRKVYRKLPNYFLCSDLRRSALLELLNKLEVCHSTQKELDCRYNDLCVVLYKEMGKYTQDKYSTPKSKKAHKISKPYWNKELQDLCYDMHTSERLFLEGE